MSQTINCRYSSYDPSADLTILGRILLPFCEQFNLHWYRQEFTFHINTDDPQIFLDKRCVFARPTIDQKYGDARKFQTTSWRISTGPTGVTIDLELRELKPMPLLRLLNGLSPDVQAMVAAVTVELAFVALAAVVYAVASFPDPAWAWDWVADHLRLGSAVVLTSIVIIGSSRFDGSGFLGTFFIMMTAFTLAIIWFACLLIPIRDPAEPYTVYLNTIRGQLSAPLIVIISPWLVILLKAIGFDFFTSIASTLTKQLESEKKAAAGSLPAA